MCSSRLSLTYFELEGLQKQDLQKGDPAARVDIFVNLYHLNPSPNEWFQYIFMGVFLLKGPQTDIMQWKNGKKKKRGPSF